MKKLNLILITLFTVGLALFIYYFIEYNKVSYEYKGSLRGLGYTSLFIILTASYILLAKFKKVILSNIILVFLLLLIVEVFCFFKLGKPSAYKKDFSAIELPEDHIAKHIGVVPYADSVYHTIKMQNNDTVFNFKSTIDSNCKRATPNNSGNRSKHALFFGCSITFGEGVQDNETMPYFFQEESNEYNAYNFGLSGHSTNHMLARLQYKPLDSQVKEKDGVAFYVFFWDHIYRSIGSMNRYTEWLHNAPFYYLDNGNIKRNKMFCDGRIGLSRIYESLYQTNIVKKFKLDLPIRIRKSHLNLVAEMINESKKIYQTQYPNNEFYCVIYPEWGKAKDNMTIDFKMALQEKGIKYIDFSWFEYKQEHTLGKDAHPNPKTHKTMANLILKEINKKK